MITKDDPEFVNILKQNTILRVITGSTSYGLNTETSDVDEKSIVILPKEHFFQLGEPFETLTTHQPDHEYHTLKKFMELANNQNPTILEILNTRDQFILEAHPLGLELRQYADIFLSQNCYQSFGGYAREQLMRLKTGLNRASVDDNLKYLTETLENLIQSFSEKYPIYNDGTFRLSHVDFNNVGKYDINLNINYDNIPIQQLYAMVSEIGNTSKTYNKMNSRNRKPEEKLEKHAMHIIRLLIKGAEILTTGKLDVYCEKDRDFLLGIRQGKYTWDEIFEMVKEYELQLTQAKERTVLPLRTDRHKIHKLYNELMTSWFRIQFNGEIVC